METEKNIIPIILAYFGNWITASDIALYIGADELTVGDILTKYRIEWKDMSIDNKIPASEQCEGLDNILQDCQEELLSLI